MMTMTMTMTTIANETKKLLAEMPNSLQVKFQILVSSLSEVQAYEVACLMHAAHEAGVEKGSEPKMPFIGDY